MTDTFLAKAIDLLKYYTDDNPNFEPADGEFSTVAFRLAVPEKARLSREMTVGLQKLHRNALGRIRNTFDQLRTVQLGEATTYSKSNGETVIIVHDDAQNVRGVLTSIIETHPLGGFFDIAVLDRDGNIAKTPRPLPCPICDGEDSEECQKTNRHSDIEIIDCLDTLLFINDYYA